MSCPRYAFVPFCLAALALAQEPKVTLTPEVYPDSALTEHGGVVWHTARIVDAITGAPLAGAEVLFLDESAHPMRGEMWWQERATADADGFVRQRIVRDGETERPKWFHWVIVRAPGHGPIAEMRHIPRELMRLAPGQSLPVRVRNWRGDPVADALVGYCKGCGHTPDLANARTNAEGIAVLRDVELHHHICDLYIEHPALHLGYDEPQWLPGMPPFDFYVEPSVAVAGVVVDAAGRPVAAAHVGTKDVHRGPWTRTRADGSFGLYGTDVTEGPTDLFVHVGDREVCFARPPQQPFRLQLPPPDGEREQRVALPPPDPNAQEVTFRVVDREGNDLEQASVRWTGPLPARSEGRSDLRGGDATAALVPGRYEVLARGDGHAETVSTIEVTRGGENAFALAPTSRPTFFLRAVDMPELGTVELRTETWRRDVTEQARTGAPIGAPEVPFCVVLLGHHQRRILAFTPEQALAAGTLRVRWFAPTRVEGRLVDAQGAPLEGEIALVPVARRVPTNLDDPDEDERVATKGAFSLPTDAEGLAFLVVRAETRPPRYVPVVLPPRGDDAHVDVGTIVSYGPPRLVLQDAVGEPLAGERVALIRPGWHGAALGGAPAFAVDASGVWFGPEPRAGDAIEVSAPGNEAPKDGGMVIHDLRALFPITGDGPWTLRLPAGELDLDVRDEKGESLEATVFVGSECVHVDEPTRLRRLPLGAHRLFVTADDRMSAIVEVTLAAGARPTVKVTLPPR